MLGSAQIRMMAFVSKYKSTIVVVEALCTRKIRSFVSQLLFSTCEQRMILK